MDIKKVVFITRTKDKKDLDSPDLEKLILGVFGSGIINRYAVSNFSDPNYEISSKNVSVDVSVIKDDDPASPTSLNTALKKIEEDKVEPDAFLVCSKEVKLKKNDIKKLKRVMEKNLNTLFVVGYKFRITDKQLNKELKDYYNNKNLIAYRVPWNTCAIWNYKLFKKYVIKFDEITNKNPFDPVRVCIDNVCSQTDHRGMEDGLAIAKAASEKQEKIYFKLLKKRLPWKIKSGHNERRRHREKLARKDTVLRNFMEVRGYLAKGLEDAEKKNYLSYHLGVFNPNVPPG